MSDRIEEIRKRLVSATQGPWRPCPHKMFVFGPKREMIASTSHGEEAYGVERGTVEIRGFGGGLPMDQNHDLIVNAPTDLAFLLAELDRLAAELAAAIALREEADQRADVCHANHEGAIRKLREERDAAIRERDARQAKIDAIRALIPDVMYDGDPMTPVAAVLDCPHSESGHHWKDGCPACFADELRAHATSDDAAARFRARDVGEPEHGVLASDAGRCEECNGTGEDPVIEACPFCEGTGRTEAAKGGE